MRYRSRDVFSLGSCLLPVFHAIIKAWYSGVPTQILHACVYETVTLCGGPFQATSTSRARTQSGPTTPHSYTVSRAGSVWTSPVSLAATKGILVSFSSFPYLDASVRGVPPPYREFHRYHPWREVPFGHLRIEGSMRLPGAYRSLPRPSSAPEPGHSSGGLSCQAY